MWPWKNRAAFGAVEQLALSVPEPFVHEHARLLECAGALLERGRPVRILESGAGELPGEHARWVSEALQALAERTRGVWLPARSPLPRSEAAFDLIVQHPVAARGQGHPLHTLWAFLELEHLAAEGGTWVFTRCEGPDGNRCKYLRDYLQAVDLGASAYGPECSWRYQRAAQPVSSLARSTGALKALSPEVHMDGASFLRLYDQVFAPLLKARAGTFRAIFQTLLARPGPYTLIETGTTRESGDFQSNGQSTVLFDLFVNTFGGHVFTIDIDPTNLHYCRTRTSERTTQLCSDSVRALRGLPEVGQADLVYLDSYDFDGNNPHPSSLHHLKELAAIWNRTKPDCLVVIDDCFGPDHGKHAYVARFMAELNNPPLFSGYQTAWQLTPAA